MRLSAICKELDLPKGRVEQWGHRGLLVFDNETKPGAARECTKADAARIAMLGYLSNSGVSVEAAAKQIAQAMKHLFLFTGEKSFLVISSSRTGEIIPPTPRGGPGTKKGEGIQIVTDPHFLANAVRERDLASHLGNPEFDYSLVFDLTEIEARIDEFWMEE